MKIQLRLYIPCLNVSDGTFALWQKTWVKTPQGRFHGRVVATGIYLQIINHFISAYFKPVNVHVHAGTKDEMEECLREIEIEDLFDENNDGQDEKCNEKNGRRENNDGKKIKWEKMMDSRVREKKRMGKREDIERGSVMKSQL